MPSATAAQIIAEHNVAMRNRLAEFNATEKPIRAEFERARKPAYDHYRTDCEKLTAEKDGRMAKLALDGDQNE